MTSAAQKVAAYLKAPKQLLIAGREVAAQSGETFEIVNPATEAVIATVARGAAADIDAAVAAARRSFEEGSWRNLPAQQRAGIMQRFSALLLENLEELALIESNNNGMPITMARGSVRGSASWLNYFAGAIQRIHGRASQEALSLPGEVLAYTRKEPIGVVGLITPWNGPLSTFFIKACPALAAGCSIVHKPSELTPLTALRAAQLALEAGVPEGVINIVPGFGSDAGAAMASHPGIDKISFTGSTAVGKSLVQASAGNLKRVTLELGGKSPCVVFDDADMDVAIPGAAMAITINCGQACFAGSRLFVQKKSFDKVLSGIASFMQQLKQGDPLEEDTALGPLVSANQKQRVENYIELGKVEGELVHAGSHGMDKGYFVAPHIFAYTDPDIRIAKEEIFGPVLAATPFEDLDEIVPRANATNYGLGGGIFTTNINTAHRLAARIRTGNVWINSYSLMDPTMPFGGFKESGWGRELGEEGLDAYLETKSVYVKLA